MNYRQGLEWLIELSASGMHLGLTRIRELLARLGNPEKDMEIIHIGGTNGKGSVSAMVTAVLVEDGRQVGTFTSPHIHCYRERFKINGVDSSEDELAKAMSVVFPIVEDMIKEGFESPTEFEVNTALAFEHFRSNGVDTVVLEVGLGGEFDSTNVIEKPKVVILTNIGLEHTAILGDTKEKILATKSEIVKKDCHIVSGIVEANLQELLRQKADVKAAKDCAFNGIDFCCIGEKVYKNGSVFTYQDNEVKWEHLLLPLAGRHQLNNAALAIRCCCLLGVSRRVVETGLAKTVWPCRLELLRDDPPILLDGAHNPHGMKTLVSYLQEFYADYKIIAVMGILSDKAREEAVSLIAPLCSGVVVTKPNSPRAGDFEKVAEFFAPDCNDVTVEENIGKACSLGLEKQQKFGDKCLLVVTGSLYMIAQARGWFLGIKGDY